MKEIERLSPKEAFLKQFEDNYKDNFLPADWSKEKKDRVAELTTGGKIKTSMFTSIPMNCTGPKCVFASTCPLQKEDLAPINHECPLEMSMVKNFLGEYMEQMEIDPENLIELGMIRELVDQDVQSLRKTKILAKEDFIQENVVGVDADGDPVVRKELHLAIDYEDKIFKRRQFLLKSLLATREAKAKAGMAQIDAAKTMSLLLDSYKKVKREEERELKRQMGYIDEDDYIDVPPDNVEE